LREKSGRKTCVGEAPAKQGGGGGTGAPWIYAYWGIRAHNRFFDWVKRPRPGNGRVRDRDPRSYRQMNRCRTDSDDPHERPVEVRFFCTWPIAFLALDLWVCAPSTTRCSRPPRPGPAGPRTLEATAGEDDCSCGSLTWRSDVWPLSPSPACPPPCPPQRTRLRDVPRFESPLVFRTPWPLGPSSVRRHRPPPCLPVFRPVRRTQTSVRHPNS